MPPFLRGAAWDSHPTLHIMPRPQSRTRKALNPLLRCAYTTGNDARASIACMDVATSQCKEARCQYGMMHLAGKSILLVAVWGRPWLRNDAERCL
jgi:hypothetical protein